MIKETIPTLPIMEAFYTIQGEGFYTGHAAYFIRLGGCDVGCVWCDVKESWNADDHPKEAINVLVNDALEYAGRVAVITGGEPLMHNLDNLCSTLNNNGFRTHLETSGAHPLTGHWDWICLSPKKFKQPLPEVCMQAHELKVVVYNRSDFAWAEEFAAKVSPTCKLFLQPEWSKADVITDDIISYIHQNPKWNLSLQIHKYLGVR